MNHNKLQGRQRGWVKLILFPLTSMTKGQPISFCATGIEFESSVSGRSAVFWQASQLAGPHYATKLNKDMPFRKFLYIELKKHVKVVLMENSWLKFQAENK